MLLLQPFLLGDLELRNRIVMAPLTRTRATLPGAIPNSLMCEYYAQRATAGLIITEGTFVSDRARGWFGAPGVYTELQRKGWQNVTDAVHSAGGRIVVQLWHQGSVSSPELVGNGRTPLGPSAVNPEQLIHTGHNETEMSGVPAEMTLDDIRQAVQDFHHAAKVALDAGFDGVQIQGGFVYLFQQFMQENLNRRTDKYGGSMENRARLLFEVLEAVLDIWPSERVGVKAGAMMSERGGFRSLPSTLPTAEYVYRRLNDYSLSYVMLMGQMADLAGTPIESLRGDAVFHHFRAIYSGNLMLNAGIAPRHGEELLRQGVGEMIAFGREYIANPDLVERIRTGGPLNPQRPAGYYGMAAEGYTDYLTLAQLQTEEVTSA
jgi:N-ethylmaleimide reductase